MARPISDLEAYLERQKRRMRGIVSNTLGETCERVILRTPVLTGRLRGNWQATLGSPSNKSLLTTDPNGGVTVQAARAQAARAPGAMFYFVNNLAYAGRIEGGYSKKAPAGMLRITLAELQEIWSTAFRQEDGG